MSSLDASGSGKSTTSLFCAGKERRIFVYGDRSDLRSWMEKLTRPKAAVLLKVIEWVASLQREELIRCSTVYKHMSDSNPKLYEIRRDQARLFCCQVRNGDIVIVHWIQKKTDEIPPREIETAEKRARVVLGNE